MYILSYNFQVHNFVDPCMTENVRALEPKVATAASTGLQHLHPGIVGRGTSSEGLQPVPWTPESLILATNRTY